MLSEMHSSEWRGDRTLFNRFSDTFPADEIVQAPWSHHANVLAPPGGPARAPIKEYATYHCGCLFEHGPLIGKTLERAIIAGAPVEGKQRSASHCTVSASLNFDIDGVSGDRWNAIRTRIEEANVAFVAYSTWSYGLPEKPGVRARIVMPLDTALRAQDARVAWHGVAREFFPELTLDASSAHIYQQQGIWATAPERAHLAFRFFQRGFVISAEEALATGTAALELHGRTLRQPLASELLGVTTTSAAAAYKRLRDAIVWLDAEDTAQWIANVTAFKAAAGVIGENDAFKLVVEYSNRGSDAAKANNADSRYNPEVFFGTVAPSMPPDVGVATLCRRARDAARWALEQERGRATLSERGHAAALYLAMHHRRLFDEMRGANSKEHSYVRI